MYYNYWACALEPGTHSYWDVCAATAGPVCPRAHALQQKKAPQWEAASNSCSCQLEKNPSTAKINKQINV